MEKMLKHTALFLAALLLIAALPAAATASASAAELLYVSPNGDDMAAGTLAAPLKTLAGAKAKVAEIKASSGLPEEGIIVYFAEGTYPITESVHFTDEDSGTETARITYKAQTGAKVVFSGGITLDNSGFTDSDNDGIYEYDLSAIADLGILPYSGSADGNYSVELFSNEKPMTIARYPNSGYITITESDIVESSTGYVLTAPEGKAALWAEETDGRVLGYWHHNYSTEKYAFTADSEAGTISTNTRPSDSVYDVKAGQLYYAYNLLCELDDAGEYYIDRTNKKLYYKPIDLENETLVLSTLSDSFIKNTGGKYLTFDGLTFEYGRSGGYERYDVSGLSASATGTNITNCTFKNLAGRAIYFSGANAVISDNTIENVNVGILVSEGNMNTLTKGNVLVTKNTISNFSRIGITYTPGIKISGCGITASYNEIFNAEHEAIEFAGNDHIISNNDIHDVLLASSDMGAIYAHIGNNPKNFGFRGTQITNNYIHNLGTMSNDVYQPYNFTGSGSHRYAIYLDGACGDIVTNNIFYKTEWGVCVNSGRDNSVENNLFLEVNYPVLMTSLSAGATTDLTGTELTKYLYSGGWGIGEAHKKYSGLYDSEGNLILTGTNYGYPSGNTVSSNLAYQPLQSWNFQANQYCSEAEAAETNTISEPFIEATLEETDFSNYGTSSVKLTKNISGFNGEVGIENNDPIDLGTPKIGLFTIGDFRPGNVKEYAIDGDSSTVWRGTQNGKSGSWIEMDLNGQYLVSGINYQAEQGNRSTSDSNGCFYKAYVEVSNDRIHYKRVTDGVIKGAFTSGQTEQPSIVIPFNDGNEYVRYIRIRSVGSNYFGEGAAEISPILVDATAKSYPEIKKGTLGIKIAGTLAVGGTVYGEYLYYNSGAVHEGATKYTFYTATTADGKDLKQVATGYTNGEYPQYTIKEKDAGKYLQLALVPVDENGKEGSRAPSNFYKIADSESSVSIMEAVNSLKTQLPKETETSVALPASLENGATVNYSAKNGAYLNSDGTLKAVSSTVTDVLPTLENGDSLEYFTATVTLADGTTADYIFPITVKAKASQVYADWDYGKATEDTTLTDEEKLEATYSGLPGNKVAKSTGTGQNKSAVNGVGNKWAGYTSYTVGKWNNNANPTSLITEIDQKKTLSLWIGRVFIKPVGGQTPVGQSWTINEFVPDNIKACTSNSFGFAFFETLDSISYSSTPTLKVGEWTEVQVVASVQGDKHQAGIMQIALNGTKYNSIPNNIYVDDFKAEPLMIGSVEIDGIQEITIPENGSETVQYNSTVLNQFNTTLGLEDTYMTKKPSVTYRIKNPRPGIKINSKTGELTVTSEATAGKVIIEALVGKSEALATTVSADYTVDTGVRTGYVNPWGGGVVKSELEVNIVNPHGIYSEISSDRAVAGESFTVAMVDQDDYINGYTWYEGRENSYAAVTLETDVSTESIAKIYTAVLPKDLGDKYIKLAVTTTDGRTIYSEPVYVNSAVDADQLFVYNADGQKSQMTFSAGEKLRGLRNITNNTSEAVKAIMIIARYNASGKLIELNMSSPVEIPAGETKAADVTLTIPETLQSGDYATAFVISEKLAPYAKAITIR